jgi:ADP-L-glycero-D-manno-heptose 6-epimerase
MFVVTGGAGFIGSNIVKSLNDRGHSNIIVVDNLENADKMLNLVDCDIADYIDKKEFLKKIIENSLKLDISAIFHEGACSDTMEKNGLYMMANNYDYSKELLHYCQKNNTSFLYASSASVYGGGSVFREDRKYESPLNVYGYSKFLFDQYVRRMPVNKNSQVVGFRYFNVYGVREQHKGRMASVAFHFYNQYKQSGKIKLFEGSEEYDKGSQKIDFVSIEDVVKVKMYFLDNPKLNGIFNIGTGRSQPFNDMAVAAVNALRKDDNKSPLALEELVSEGVIEYVDFPEALKGKYQSFTQADISHLVSSGYKEPFYTVEQGVERYINSLIERDQ